MLLDGFHHLGIDEEMVHLMNTATLLLILVMLSMLIIQIAINGTPFLDKTDLIEMMMMWHDR